MCSVRLGDLHTVNHQILKMVASVNYFIWKRIVLEYEGRSSKSTNSIITQHYHRAKHRTTVLKTVDVTMLETACKLDTVDRINPVRR